MSAPGAAPVVRAATIIDVRPPPTLSAALVMGHYHGRHQRSSLGDTASPSALSPSARAHPSVLHSVAAAPAPGDEEKPTGRHPSPSVSSSDGGVTTTATAATTSTAASAREPVPPRTASRPMLSSPSSAPTVAAAGGTGAATVSDVTVSTATARKPMLSGRSHQLRLQASALAANGSGSSSSGGRPQAPTDTAGASAPPRLTAIAPSATAAAEMAAPLHAPATSLTRAPVSGRSSGQRTATGSVSLVSTPCGSLSRPPSSTTSLRRYHHLSSIAGCNYGAGSAAIHSPALSTASGASEARPLASARYTFQRATLPVPEPAPAPTASAATTSSTTDGAAGGLHPLLRQEYREMLRELAGTAGPTAKEVLPAPGGLRLPSSTTTTTATTTTTPSAVTGTAHTRGSFAHCKKSTCPLHSEAGRQAAEKAQEVERLRVLQQRHHDMLLIRNGGREAVAPRMKSSASIASSSAKLLQRSYSRRGSLMSGATASAIAFHEGSPAEAGVQAGSAGPQGCDASGSLLSAPTVARRNGFFPSPDDEEEARTGVVGCSPGVGRSSEAGGATAVAAAGAGARARDEGVGITTTTRNTDGAEEGEGGLGAPQSLYRSRAGSAAQPSRNSLKGEVIVMELYSDASSTSSRSSPDSRRSRSPPLTSTTARHRRTTVPGPQATHTVTAGGRHRIDYHGSGHNNAEDDDSDDECVFSFHTRRQSTVRRTLTASTSSLEPATRSQDGAVASLASSVVLREGPAEQASPTSRPVLRSGGGEHATVTEEDGAPTTPTAPGEEECCYCCPCRRPENFFLLCQSSPTAGGGRTAGAGTPSVGSPSLSLLASTGKGRAGADGGATVAPGVGGGVESEDSDEGHGPLLTVASFRRSSVRRPTP